MFNFFALNMINFLQLLSRKNILQKSFIYSYKTWGMFHKFPLIKYMKELLRASLLFVIFSDNVLGSNM